MKKNAVSVNTKLLLFSLAWLALNLLWSFLTEIIDDEAYYWIYSKSLDWGYFDHPPMTALLIKAGYAIFHNTVGVRLLSSLMGTATVFLVLWMTRDRIKSLPLAFLLMVSIPLLHFHGAGFLATPDVPLVFFVTLFFLAYRRYLQSDSLFSAVLLTLTIVAMLYTKYHGILVIGFTVLSNLRLLRRGSFWGVAIASTLLFLPHITWQVRNDFVSLGYHLIDRNQPFEMVHIGTYLLSQLLIFGPLTGIVLLFIGLRRKPAGPFEAALKFTFTGFFLFFLLSSLKGHVEPHWTAAALVPLLIYTLPLVNSGRPQRRNWIIAGVAGLSLVVFARTVTITELNIIPEQLNNRLHEKEEAFLRIAERAGDRPVVFENSYQDASLYQFFTGKPAHAMNNKSYRKNQYDLMDQEARLQGKSVLLVPYTGFPGCDTIDTGMGDFFLYDMEHFSWFNRVKVHPPDRDWDLSVGETFQVEVQLENPTTDTVKFYTAYTFRPFLIYSYYDENGGHKAYKDRKSRPLPDLPPGETIPYSFTVKAPEQPGEYQMLFSFGAKNMPAGINGKPVKITVRARSTGSSG